MIKVKLHVFTVVEKQYFCFSVSKQEEPYNINFGVGIDRRTTCIFGACFLSRLSNIGGYCHYG